VTDRAPNGPGFFYCVGLGVTYAMGPSTDVAAPSDVIAGLVPTTSIRKAIKGEKTKQPYAKDGKPFGLVGIWKNWKQPATGDWVGTFAVITIDANAPVADIHDRMPLIIVPGGYGDDPDPRPFPADLMRIWPISMRVNKPENDGPPIVEPIELATNVAKAASCLAPLGRSV
jgi:SOS response associated peptidase (SRAP)